MLRVVAACTIVASSDLVHFPVENLGNCRRMRQTSHVEKSRIGCKFRRRDGAPHTHVVIGAAYNCDNDITLPSFFPWVRLMSQPLEYDGGTKFHAAIQHHGDAVLFHRLD